MNAEACITSDQLLQYFRGDTAAEQLRITESHLDQCEACQLLFAKIVSNGKTRHTFEQDSMPEVHSPIASVSMPERLLDLSAQVPDTIGQYHLTGFLGSGGTGLVYSAWDELLKRPVALKFLHPPHGEGLRSQRIIREAAALARLTHPNIVRVYEVLSYQSQPILSMELVKGQNLAQWLGGQRVAPKLAAELALKLASALHHAHTKGVVHRDLKPANVMLEIGEAPNVAIDSLSNLAPKITDFGLAKIVDETRQSCTEDLFGTPAYMAPEQTGGSSQSSRPSVDIYAVGIILYEMLTGRPPFIAESVMQTLALVQHATPVSPRVHNAYVSRDLEMICMKCLEKSPTDRYATASALGDDLGAYLEGYPVSARPISALTRSWRWMSRNRVLTAMMLTVIVSLCGIAIGGQIVAARENHLRSKAAQLLLRAEESERQKALQLETTVTEARSLWNSLVQSRPKSSDTARIFESFFAAYIKSLPPPAEWTELDLNITELYTFEFDQASPEYRRLVTMQIVAASRLCEENPNNLFILGKAARMFSIKGIFLNSSNEDRRECFEKAYEYARRSVALDGSLGSDRLLQAIGGNLSSVYSSEGRHEESFAVNLECLPSIERAAETDLNPQFQYDVADRLARLVSDALELKPPKRCEEFIDKANKRLEPLLADPAVGEKSKALMETLRLRRIKAAELNCL